MDFSPLVFESHPRRYATRAGFGDSWVRKIHLTWKTIQNAYPDLHNLYYHVESAYRIPEDKSGLPRIPVQPIGYDDAQVLLGNMTGPDVNPDWKGKLNITYRLGPGFLNPRWLVCDTLRVCMTCASLRNGH